MMFSLLFYEPESDPPTILEDLVLAVQDAGAVLDGDPSASYRPGRWQDGATGATAIIDLGESPLEADGGDRATSYAGWRPIPFSAQIPLVSPHWQAVETVRWIEGLLSRWEGIRALDLEDTREHPEAEPGPFAWNRLRLLASWERQQADQISGVTGLARCDRAVSIALWRYRRERGEGALAAPDCTWPEALVLGEGSAARTVAVWNDPSRPLALPPVEFLVLNREQGSGLLPVDELLTATGGGTRLPLAGACRIPPSDRTRDLHRRAHLIPPEAFRALADGDWVD